jgi:arylsulfatase A-like enzyme
VRSASASRICLIAAMALGPLVAISKCVLDPDGDSFPPLPKRVTMDVALIVVDGLPANALHVFQPNARVQHEIDELSRLGISCFGTIAAADRSPAAIASLLTGQLPSTHGVIDFTDRLAATSFTLPLALRSAGFTTAGFSNAPIFSLSGLDVGLDVATDDPAFDAERIGERAAAFASDHRDRDFFLLAHYAPRAGEDPSVAAEVLTRAVCDGLRRARAYEGTVVVLAGSFDRRGGELRVPLVFKIPKRTAIGAKRVGPCSLLDVMPTLLDFFGQFHRYQGPGRSLQRGKDGNNPLFSGFHFPGMALSERFRPGDRRPILGLRTHQLEITVGPAPTEIAVYDRFKDADGSRNLAVEPGSQRAKDLLLKELFDRKPTIGAPWPVGTAPPAEPRWQAFLEAAGAR